MKTLFLTASMITLMAFNGLTQDVAFPRQLTNNGSVLTMYQPQVENWNNYTQIDYRLAFSLLPSGGKEALGVMYMHSSTEVDMNTHLANVYNMSIKDVHFPSLNASDAATMSALVKTFLTPGRSLLMSVEQIAACTPKQTPANTVSVENNPPVIFVSYNATILLQLQGASQTSATGQANLDYIYNANYPLFIDNASSSYFLYDGLEWRKSASLNGQWAFTSSLPKSLVTLAKDASWTNLKGIVPAVTKKASVMPDVFFSEELAEMILFNGQPKYQTIPGTSLKHATNTDEQVFLSNATNQYYFLTSGRWFSAPGLTGPWSYASASLPADFSNIPSNSPAATVLSSVPGTEEAADAVLIAQIPTTKQVDPNAAQQINIVYGGTPEFTPIQTTSLEYAVNTTDKVIMVSSSQYYACVNGVWYLANVATGPWQIATSIPASIYTIPSSSPVYNVTFVTQTVTTSGSVQSSYTSGYMGAFIVGVGVGAIIASGSGYYYPPYYYHPPYGYPCCYSYPMTYGAYAYHPYPYGGVSYGAAYNPYTGTYARSASAYGPYGSATAAQAYNPYTGTAARGGSVSTPYGTTSAAQAYNPYSGKSASTVQNSNAYGQSGSSSFYNNKTGQSAQTQHNTTAQGTTASGSTSSGGAFAGASGAKNSGGVAKTSNGDMYASANGNVYKNTGNGWQSNSGSGWNDASKSQGASSQGFNSQSMNQEAQNRQRGNTQTQQFGNSSGGWGGGGSSGFSGGGSSRSGGGGGGFSGGGGGFSGGGGFGGGRGGRR